MYILQVAIREPCRIYEIKTDAPIACIIHLKNSILSNAFLRLYTYCVSGVVLIKFLSTKYPSVARIARLSRVWKSTKLGFRHLSSLWSKRNLHKNEENPLGVLHMGSIYVKHAMSHSWERVHYMGPFYVKAYLTTGSCNWSVRRNDFWELAGGVACTDPARNDFWELAGSLPVNARSRGRLGLRLGLLYSRKAWSQGLLVRASLAKSPERDPRTHAIVTGPG